ncbi:hypothetical protein PAXRUDRAFT_174241 [Paxillus rubicundulus Ve08.2h10]|uniref:Uncharacterized protein n=1 Tax=Paxillus rubicundulus Ve08.2h10 TaxID=930991 RepID=A0A0D0CIJ3_9AGAM|nr:hypothetical protein PAXRUDRAFT_174241 [Paxillus rubicundulus Ve08.2h10]
MQTEVLLQRVTSATSKVQVWLLEIASVQQIFVDVLQVAYLGLHKACSQTLSAMRSHPHLQGTVTSWPAIFEVMQLIVNCITPWHQDPGGYPEAYDCLLNLGNCQDTGLDIANCLASLSYPLGSVIYLTGKVLIHLVKAWGAGWERAVIVHFIKDMVQDRLGVARPQIPNFHQYLA